MQMLRKLGVTGRGGTAPSPPPPAFAKALAAAFPEGVGEGFLLIEGEHEFFAVTGGERDAGALVEIVEVQGLRTQASGTRFELCALLLQRGDTAFQRALLRLQIDVRDEALPARHGMRAEIQNGRSQPQAEGRRPMFRHRTDPDSAAR